mgnify:CR=1 FL=1
MSGLWLIMGGLFGMSAVGAGAYGWHSLDGDEDLRLMFMLGVDYQMWHALALAAVAWIASRPEMLSSKLPLIAGIAFSSGIVLFSGTLYIFVMTGTLVVEGAAPAGGYLMMAGWAALIAAGWKLRKAAA